MFEQKDEALKYIVHIAYGRDAEGSGVIIPLENEEYFYVFTAKHTFGKDDNERGDKYYLIKESDILKKNIIISSPIAKNIDFEIESVLILENDPKLDFLILKIKNNNYVKLTALDIYEEEFTYCLPYGYSDLSKEGNTSYEPFNCEHKPIVSNDKLEIRIIDYLNIRGGKGTESYMKGISGAGIFVENHSKDTIYLVGIVIKGTSTLTQTLVCLDLVKLSKKINKHLINQGLKKVTVSGAEWKNKFGFDMSDLDFEKEIGNFQKDSKNKFIRNLKENDLDKVIKKFDDEVKTELSKEEESFQKISEVYLYLGMIFHKVEEHRRATHYFNKAIEYGGNKNKSYLLDAKSKREEEKSLSKKSAQEKELMVNIVNSFYLEIYNYEKQLENNEEDNTTKRLLIKLYKELIEKLNFFDDRESEIFIIHEKLITLYTHFKENDDIKEEIAELKDMIKLGQQFKSMKNQVNDYKKEIYSTKFKKQVLMFENYQ